MAEITYETEKKLYLSKIDTNNEIISKILESNNSLKIVNSDQVDRLQEIVKKNNSFKHKLQSNEFEIAIVGLEKAGKSTFANALIENYVLPSAPERCTFTTTRLVSGNDEATVVFYNEEEFNKIFQEMLSELKYPNFENITFKNIDREQFEAYFHSLEEKDNALYKSHIGKTEYEILDIIQNRDRLRLDGSVQNFKGDELLGQQFQAYIKGEKDDTSKPRSVKQIEIKSSKLNQIKSAIIYDVPGFDSPTQLHRRQTEERLKNADAIILVTNVGTNPSIQGTSLSIITKNSDSDGIALKDKLFVFGNQIDRVNNESQIEGNKNILINDVEKYHIGERKRVFVGSAYKYLVTEKGIITDKEYQSKYDIDSGIEDIRASLTNYYESERFEILKKKINSSDAYLKTLFKEILQSHSFENLIPTSAQNLSDQIIIAEQRNITERVTQRLKYFIEAKKQQIYSEKYLTESIKSQILTDKFFSKFYSIEDARILNNESSRLDYPVGQVNRETRKRIHRDFLEEYVELIRGLTDSKCTEFEIELLKEFATAVSGSENITVEVNALCKQIVHTITSDVNHNSERFLYLVERFSRDIFDIILSYPIASEDRMTRFKEAQHDIIHLDHYYSKNSGRLINLLLKQKDTDLTKDTELKIANLTQNAIRLLGSVNGTAIIIQELQNNLALLKDFAPTSIQKPLSHLDDMMTINQIKPSITPQQLIEELNNDIINLKSIIIKAIIPAIDLEVAFVNSLDKQVKSLLSAMLNTENKHSANFTQFLSMVLRLVKKVELGDIQSKVEMQNVKQEILELIAANT